MSKQDMTRDDWERAREELNYNLQNAERNLNAAYDEILYNDDEDETEEEYYFKGKLKNQYEAAMEEIIKCRNDFDKKYNDFLEEEANREQTELDHKTDSDEDVL